MPMHHAPASSAPLYSKPDFVRAGEGKCQTYRRSSRTVQGGVASVGYQNLHKSSLESRNNTSDCFSRMRIARMCTDTENWNVMMLFTMHACMHARTHTHTHIHTHTYTHILRALADLFSSQCSKQSLFVQRRVLLWWLSCPSRTGMRDDKTTA